MAGLEEQLVAELWARDVRFILGTVPNHPPMLSPAELIKGLAVSVETRLQLSLIPLFLRHPEFYLRRSCCQKSTIGKAVDTKVFLLSSSMARTKTSFTKQPA